MKAPGKTTNHSAYLGWKDSIDDAIADVCLRIIKEPLIYFSEADIQQLLVEALRRIEPLQKIYPTAVQKGKGSKATYRTTLVHREYGGGGRTRLDIVVFDPADVAKIDNVNLTIRGKYLKPAYAFELGTEKTPDTKTHLENDLKKLHRRTKGIGYIIHVYKDVTQARTGTRSREKTEGKIENQFKDAITAKYNQEMPNIKMLAILLRTYRHQTRMRGKCEIFKGETWRKVNVSRDSSLRSAIIKQLA